jgi:hypothetical protein
VVDKIIFWAIAGLSFRKKNTESARDLRNLDQDMTVKKKECGAQISHMSN